MSATTRRSLFESPQHLMRVFAAMIALGLSPHTGLAGDSFYPDEFTRLEKIPFVFFHNGVVEDRAIGTDRFEKLKDYRVCLTNGYANFEGDALKELQSAGCEVFLYKWFDGYYRYEMALEDDPADATAYYRQFPHMVAFFRDFHTHPEWLINPETPLSGGGAVHPAFFYDYNNPEMRQHLIAFLVCMLKETGYNGVFFDYIGGWALPDEVKAIWTKKYPHTPYQDAAWQFLKELKAAAPDKLIFGNQAYRLPVEFYDVIDYDISESHATSFVMGKTSEIYLEGEGLTEVLDTFYREWGGPNGYAFHSSRRREHLAEKPRVTFFDINYVQPWYVRTGKTTVVDGKCYPVHTRRTDRPAIFYGYVLGRITDVHSCASDWYAPGYGEDSVYALDLGEPMHDQYVETEDCVLRYFENGILLATKTNAGVETATDPALIPADAEGLWDVYEGIKVCGWTPGDSVTVCPAFYPSTCSFYPSGRVFLYLKD